MGIARELAACGKITAGEDGRACVILWEKRRPSLAVPGHRASHRPLATTDDIRPILGALDETKLLEIGELRPVKDVEVASLWLTGDADIFGAGRPLKGMTMRVVAERI